MSATRRTLLVAALLFSPPPFAAAQSAATPAGHWEGKIQIPDHEMGFTVDLTKNTDGGWIGSLSVLTSTTVDVPLDNISIDAAAVRFTASLPKKTTFEGRLSSDATELSGTVSNLDGAVPFQLTRHGDANVRVPPPSSPLSKAFEGTWEATREAAGRPPKRIILKLTSAPDGTALATLTDTATGQEIPITTVIIKDTQLELEARVVSGTYRGTLGAGGEIAGEWRERSAQVPLTFKRAPAEPR